MSRISSLVSGGRMIRKACGMTIEIIARLWRHAERAGGLHLTLGHRLDAGPDRLGHVGTADQAERERHRAEAAARDLAAREGEREADTEEDEDDQRRQTAEELDRRPVASHR